MSRIHPAVNGKSQDFLREIDEGQWDRSPSKFTVWKRSSMSFQGTDGFTVFDKHGKLAFRVDNYSRKSGCILGGGEGGLVLMNGTGSALLSLKPKQMSMRREWNGFVGDCSTGGESRKFRAFSLRKSLPFTFLGDNSRYTNEAEAEVFVGGSRDPEYRIEGSFWRRNCCIRRTSTGEMVAKISRKKANQKVMLGNEVFSLMVQPGLDNGLVMGFIVVLDRICRQSSVGPFLCSC